MKPLPTKHPDVIFQKVTDGAVLLSTADEIYYGLDPVGARIWELMTPELGSFEALCQALEAQYPDVLSETIRADAREFLDAMLEAGLLQSGEKVDTGDSEKTGSA